MRPSNTNPYRLWSCLPALPNLGNRQRQQLRREGKRQRDTYEETDELERERWTYIFIERERERGEERRFHNAATLCRHFHESFERLPRWPFLACTPNRKSIACNVHRNTPFNYDRGLASKVVVAPLHSQKSRPVLLRSPLGHVRLPSAVLGRSTHHNFSPYSGAYKYVYVHLLNNNVNK